MFWTKWSQISQKYGHLSIYLEPGNAAQRTVSCYEYPDCSVLCYTLVVIVNEKFNSHFSNNRQKHINLFFFSSEQNSHI